MVLAREAKKDKEKLICKFQVNMLGVRVRIVSLVAPFVSSVSLQQCRSASHRFGYLRQVPAISVSDDFQRHSKDVKRSLLQFHMASTSCVLAFDFTACRNVAICCTSLTQ